MFHRPSALTVTENGKTTCANEKNFDDKSFIVYSLKTIHNKQCLTKRAYDFINIKSCLSSHEQLSCM